MGEGLKDIILVIGLGSPIVSDDRVGLEVARRIEEMRLDGVETRQEAIGGLDIIPMIMGYRRVIIVDSIKSEARPPGTVMVFDPEDFAPTVTDSSAHDVNLATAMHLGRRLEPDSMPDQVRFVAVEVEELLTVSEEMTPAVEAAVPDAVAKVLELLDLEVEGAYIE